MSARLITLLHNPRAVTDVAIGVGGVTYSKWAGVVEQIGEMSVHIAAIGGVVLVALRIAVVCYEIAEKWRTTKK